MSVWYDGNAGLSDQKARSYSAVLGRFMSPDPLGYVDGPNVYQYVMSNPLGWVDPWGLQRMGGRDPYLRDMLGRQSRGFVGRAFDWVRRQFQNPCPKRGRKPNIYEDRLFYREFGYQLAKGLLEEATDPLAWTPWGRIKNFRKAKRALNGIDNAKDNAEHLDRVRRQQERADRIRRNNAEVTKGGKGRHKNDMVPHKGAQGAPHTTIVRDPDSADVKKYQTWEPNPRNPNDYDSVKRFDSTGDPHHNKNTGEYVAPPHIHTKSTPGGVRPATPAETPKTSPNTNSGPTHPGGR